MAVPPAYILVVDDNEANRQLARCTLEDEGYRVALAASGLEAIGAFEAEPPDCILLDVRMPGLDGLAVCKHIRATPRGDEVPIVFLTALREVETFDLAQRAGGDDFLTKPIRPTELVLRVQAALKLRRLRAELHEHYALLKKQRDDLMRLQLQKERLTAFVVHDLKNPVYAMDLYAQILLRDGGLGGRSRQAAIEIRDAAHQLNRMILNLLDISKADEGKLVARPAELDARALVATVLSDLAVTAAGREVQLASALASPRLRADEDLILRVLANLVENAIRHTPAGSTVTIAVDATPGGTEVRVADVGRGVPPELRERIFDPFVQVDPDAGNDVTRAGRGLGLSFCKLAVEAHGGAIWVEDGAPGSVFCVRLPDEA
jgi:signal transduction histidine kinase